MQLPKPLKAVLWILSIFSQAKSFADNPVLGSSRFNRWGLHVFRLRLAHGLSRFRRFFLERKLTPQDVEAFEHDGFILKEHFLPAPSFESLYQEVFEQSWPMHEMKQGNSITQRVFLDNQTLLQRCPSLHTLITDARLKNLIRYVASTGGEPVFSIQVIATTASNQNDPQTSLHADTFHSNAKAWFFLEKVEEDGGPLSYLAGSHKLTKARLDWEKHQSIDASNHPKTYHARGSLRLDKELHSQFPADRLKVFSVAANTLVVADTFGFHARSISLKPTMRFEIYASLRRNPFSPANGLHYLSLPWNAGKVGSAYLKSLNIMKRWGLGKNPWSYKGEKKLKPH